MKAETDPVFGAKDASAPEVAVFTAGRGGWPRAAWRWLWRGLAAALLAWLLVTFVHQVVTGSYWLWGIPDPLPLLVFLAGPPMLLAATTMLALARSGLPQRDRILISLSAAVLGVITLHLLLAGSWVWVLPDLLPPLLYLLLPLALLTVVAVLRWRRALERSAWWTVLVASLATLGLGVGASGLNIAALTGAGAGPAPAGAVRVVSWDTLHWDTSEQPARFYRFLVGQHADIYLLQDYAHPADGPQRPVDEAGRLRQEFPGYHFASSGDLLTISRFPIVQWTAFETNPAPPPGTANIPFLKSWKYTIMRTDVLIRGELLSVYNVHFYDTFSLDVVPLSPTFFRNVRALAEARHDQFVRLHADIAANPHPVLVSGNFNTLPGGNDLRLLGTLRDATRSSRSVYPATFAFIGPALWRMDWTFTSPDVGVYQYTTHGPQGLSSHSVQNMLVSLPSSRPESKGSGAKP
jgi:endonuclease/exonuclease/phosphatase (EEP) superfamily protein YafD